MHDTRPDYKTMNTKAFKATAEYVAGEIAVDFSDIPEWSKEDLTALADWLEHQLIHYGPSAAYKAAKGDPEKFEKIDGRYKCEAGVFKLVASWRSGDKNEKQIAAYQKRLDAAVKKFTDASGRKPTDAELSLIKMTL